MPFGDGFDHHENSENPSDPSSDNSQNSSPYGGNMQYQWNYESYQQAVDSKKKSKNKKKSKGLLAFLISICSVFAVAVIGLAGYGIYNLANGGKPLSALLKNAASSKASGGASITLNNQPQTSSSKTASGQMTIQEIAKSVRPCVVDIVDYNLSQIGETGEGSGIIISQDGYVVTNDHVISGANKVKVILADSKQYDAKVIGADAHSDLAVLKIEATGLSYATFGNSDQMVVGDTVIAIGNPGGIEFAGTVTNGIVSALNREVVSNGYSNKYIQTTAAINPGNSGGALVNMYGQIIGINSAKISDVDYEGMGFAIPINTAKPVIESLMNYGYVQGRVKLGITVSEFSSTEASIYKTPSGLLVESVDSSSDAAAKGIKTQDIITKINNKDVQTFDDLYNEETKYKAGQTVTLTVYRYSTGKTFTVAVKLLEDTGSSSSSQATASQQQNPYSNGGTDSSNGFFNFP